MVSGRTFVLFLVAVSVLGLAAGETDAQEIARGIYFRLGEKLITELSPAGDTDTFVFYGVTGAKVTLTLKARDGSIAPTMVLYDAGMNMLNTAAWTKVSGTKVKLRKYPLPSTVTFSTQVMREP